MKISCNNLQADIQESVSLRFTDFYNIFWNMTVQPLEKGASKRLPSTSRFQYKFNETYKHDNGNTVKLLSSNEVFFAPRVTMIDWKSLSKSMVQNYLNSEDKKIL